jgi:hypothetical protein
MADRYVLLLLAITRNDQSRQLLIGFFDPSVKISTFKAPERSVCIADKNN